MFAQTTMLKCCRSRWPEPHRVILAISDHASVSVRFVLNTVNYLLGYSSEFGSDTGTSVTGEEEESEVTDKHNVALDHMLFS